MTGCENGKADYTDYFVKQLEVQKKIFSLHAEEIYKAGIIPFCSKAMENFGSRHIARLAKERKKRAYDRV